jgi:DNA-directed RNA polymerase specialized sigma24 family protein
LSAREPGGSLDSLRRLSDEELARVAAGGEEGAARVLLERFEEPLYRYTLALVRDPDLAREATWSALFEAARAVRVDDYSEPVQPWLFRVAHTAADVAGGRPNGTVENDEAAARAAAAGGEDRARLEGLLAGLDALPDHDRGSLLLRELVGLEYTGIATVTGERASAARQSVFRARLGLQENPEALTEHCDEIRAAMSKAEVGVRERRSIATHLATCPVCDEFARQLETRPDDFRALFPAPEEPLAAELVPPLPPVAAGERPAAAAAAGAAAISPAGERPGRDRRRALVAIALAVVLVAAGIATALALNDNGGGGKGKARAARESSVTLTAPQRTTTSEKPAHGKKPAKPAKPKAPAKPKGTKAAGGGSETRSGAKGSAGGGSATTSGASSKNGGSATTKSGESSKNGGSATTSGESSKNGGSATTSGESSKNGGSANSGSASANGGSASTAPANPESAQAQPGEQAAERTVPRTGLDVSLVVVMGLLMLAVGISLRRVYAEP